ncbi:MAG: hypothetical protein M3246_09415, partial [Actinomycetota bacterium]|nr:hypothetical protein [Actinomycetota bacterium]
MSIESFLGTVTWSLRRSYKIFVLVLAFTLASGALAFATTDSPGSGPLPTISSDKPDYAPGETVVLTGENWQPGELVRVQVDAEQEYDWSRSAEVTAGEDGTIGDEFRLPDYYVPRYHVAATGEISGTATMSFTDGNIRVNSSPSGVTFDLTHEKYNSTGCTGTITQQGTQNNVGSTAGAFSIGASNTESVKLVAEPVSNNGRSFVNWTSSSSFTQDGAFDPTSSPRIICVNGFSGTGNRDYQANYASDTAAVNDAPLNLVPGAQAINEDPTSPLVFSIADDNYVLTSDVDAGSNPVEVDLEVDGGTLTLSGTSGLTFTTGEG